MEVISETLQIILENEEFINKIETQIKYIAKDNVIDKNDIPALMVLIGDCYNNINQFHISYEDIPDLMNELITYLLNKHNLVKEDNKEAVFDMIENCIKLIMFQPRVRNKCIKLYNKYKCW
jgi:hypothetical protein